MKKPNPKQKKIQGELTEADLAKVIGGVLYSPANKRRRNTCCDSIVCDGAQ